jgi:metal-dependent amidase/aminoacylase/carboxypeptidase family protein
MGANSFAAPTQALVTIVHAKLRLGEIAFGTTPGKAEIMATLRASETKVLERMIPLAEKQVRGIASGWDLGVDVGQTEYFKTTFNDAELTRELRQTCTEFGLETITPNFAFPWSEDFGRFSDISRVLLFGLGAGHQHPQLHHQNYDFPDELLVTGLRVFLAMLEEEDQPD